MPEEPLGPAVELGDMAVVKAVKVAQLALGLVLLLRCLGNVLPAPSDPALHGKTDPSGAHGDTDTPVHGN